MTLPLSPLVFRNGHVLTECGFDRDVSVVVEDGHIVAVLPGEAASGAHAIDLHGGYLVPGFIDTQVNGGGDVLFNDMPTVEGLRHRADAHAHQR